MATYTYARFSVPVSPAVGLPATQVWDTPARRAHITMELSPDPVRYRFDGGSPTATVGHLADIDHFQGVFEGADLLRNLQFIAVTSPLTLYVTLEGP